MSSRTAARSAQKSRPASVPPAPHPRNWVTQLAFFLTLVLVIVRMTITEVFRTDVSPQPGSVAAPAVPGPAVSMVLDLLCCLPALLVLFRRVIDDSMRLRLSWAMLPMLLLGGWTLVSVAWASDKFAAAVQGAHWAAALVMIWSTAQLVRGWIRLRLIAGVAYGLLLVLLVQGYYYRFADLPDLQRQWHEHKDQLLKERGASGDSREATQIGKNIESGEVTGFNISRNTYAAVLVLLMTVSAGMALQRVADGDGKAAWIGVALGIALALPMLYLWVQSKTAFLTPVFAAIVLAVMWRYRERIIANARRLFFAAVSAFVLGVAAAVGHGLYHGTLLHVSLTFRWQYWVGAARVFVHHPWLGVGWANFGPFYLIYRLPRAAEEPADPHNFFVRAFVELGIVGGLLTIAWVFRLAWELTQRPVTAAPASAVNAWGSLDEALATRRDRNPYGPAVAIPYLLALGGVAMVLSAAFSIDFGQSGAWVFLESFRKILFLIALLAGLGVVSIRSMTHQELDDRPAPWLLYGVLTGVFLFLLHNLIDFSLFETGPMFLFALLCGAALGLRMKDLVSLRLNRFAAAGLFVVVGVGWVTAAGIGVLPVVSAESLAQDADAELRQGNLEAARIKLFNAFQTVPINADYAFRAEQAAVTSGASPTLMRQLTDSAIGADPVSARFWLARARIDAAAGDPSSADADYQHALSLDPCDLEMRLEFAGRLRDAKQPARARAEYQKVLELNAELAPDEIKRLPPERIGQIERMIEKLKT